MRKWVRALKQFSVAVVEKLEQLAPPSKGVDPLAVLETRLQRTINECAVYKALADLSDRQRKTALGMLTATETAIEEMRVQVLKHKKDKGLVTPVKVTRSQSISLSSSTHRLMNSSISALVA